jgi:hypothetical protein
MGGSATGLANFILDRTRHPRRPNLGPARLDPRGRYSWFSTRSTAESIVVIARLHVFIGILGLLVFLASGLTMLLADPPLSALDGQVRMMLRSRHIYLLYASLLNLLLGVYYRPAAWSWRQRLQTAGSSLLLFSPALAVAGFFIEAPEGDLSAPLGRLAVVAAAIGTLLHAIAAIRRPS